MACKAGHEEIVKLLIQVREGGRKEGREGGRARQCKAGHEAIARLLLQVREGGRDGGRILGSGRLLTQVREGGRADETISG